MDLGYHTTVVSLKMPTTFRDDCGVMLLGVAYKFNHV